MEKPAIKLVVCDNDGCLMPEHNSIINPQDLEPIRAHNARAHSALDASWSVRSGQRPRFDWTGLAASPLLTICTGRPQPFVELLQRWIHCPFVPAVAEGGVLTFSLADNTTRMDPAVTREHISLIRDCRDWCDYEMGWNVQAGKQAMVSLYVPQADERLFGEMIDGAKRQIHDMGWPLRVERTVTYINISLAHVSKASGVNRLLDELGLDGRHVLAIGDTTGDLVLREICGLFACPANAMEEVKRAADYVSDFALSDGVADIIASISRR